MRRLPKRSAGWRAKSRRCASRARRAERRQAREAHLLLLAHPLAAGIGRIAEVYGRHLAQLATSLFEALAALPSDVALGTVALVAELTSSARDKGGRRRSAGKRRRLAPRGGKALQGCR